ncbi:MAG: diacylglycerol kinase family protein [Rhodovibrionaceae bacterium]
MPRSSLSQPQKSANRRAAAKRLLVIYNPVAGSRRGRRQRYEAVLRRLRAAGSELTVRETTQRGDAESFAAGLTRQDCDLLVVAGGDGTINEVVNGLGENRLGGAALPLGIIPLGTANVLAIEIGLRLSPEAVAKALLEGVVRPIGLGEANGRRFLLMAGAGFDAHVVAGVDSGLKRWLGKGAYVWETLRQFRRYPFPNFRLTIDGEKTEACSVIAANARHYGGRFMIARAARLEEPSLEVCLFTQGGRWHAMLYAAALIFDLLPRMKSVRHIRCKQLTIDGPLEDPVQGDGDIVASLPAKLRILPAALNLVFPPEAK